MRGYSGGKGKTEEDGQKEKVRFLKKGLRWRALLSQVEGARVLDKEDVSLP